MLNAFTAEEYFLLSLVIILLVLTNAFFVASEFALVSVRHSRIDELINNGNKRAKRVKRVIEKQDDVISATQLGITLASLALGWTGELTLESFFSGLDLDNIFGDGTTFGLSAVIAFMLITYMHVVLGELAPKSLALQHAEETALWVAWPMEKFTQLTRPLIILFNGTAWLILRIFGVRPLSGHRLAHSEEELKLLISQSEKAGLLESKESDILQKTFDLPDTMIREIMTPRVELVIISVEDPFKDIVKLVRDSGHSRIPVYEDNKDNIIGLLYAKDLLKYYAIHLENSSGLSSNNNPSIRDILRKPDFVPETMFAHKLLTQFQSSKRQVAVVTNEFGGVEGIVSLEDILEQLVGDIQDEYDSESPEITKMDENSSEVSAQTSLEDFNQYFKTKFESEQSVTIGGYLVENIGELPEEGETHHLENITFKIAKKNGFRIETLIVDKTESLLPEEEEKQVKNGKKVDK
ncbi:MAG: Magnesium and cobalt efflux protein CorC [Candidatus Heimdallarchaeota archaeon LC_3]|nr:MAG: Magnesium and cobalt efflux protein CorC [Candidatus Heimdallarchaeota archaeon LC_3]